MGYVLAAADPLGRVTRYQYDSAERLTSVTAHECLRLQSCDWSAHKPDPLLAETGQPYAYVNDDPASATDPSGECPRWLCGLVSAVGTVARVLGSLAKTWYDTHQCGGPESATFVVTSRSVAYNVPSNWVARVADNGKGIVFQEPGATGRANSVRIMEPTARYPNGYARVYNSNGQVVDSLGSLGNPLGRAATHFPEDELGEFPELPVP